VRNDLIIAQKDEDLNQFEQLASNQDGTGAQSFPQTDSKSRANISGPGGIGGGAMMGAATASSFKSAQQNNSYNMNFSGANFFINTSTSGFFREGGGLLGNIDAMTTEQLRERLVVAETLMKKLYNRNKDVELYHK